MSEPLSSVAIDREAEALKLLATKIWENPELAWNEYQASRWTADYLASQGFAAECGAYGLDTAVRAVWGSGKPVVGFCGEYDALPGLSQKVAGEPDPVEPGAPGHGCGHNLLGVGCVAACIGLKAALEEAGLPGTVIYYGCPAEEGGSGKSWMARAGAFSECDFCVAWHPHVRNENSVGAMNGITTARFTFHGRKAHAALNPQDGRSALDAVQLMNLGCEFLREHVGRDVRMHYTIVSPGMPANIVPDEAAVEYTVRALTSEAIEGAFSRVADCAEGAAKMTGTTVTVQRLGGVYPTLENPVLAETMLQAQHEVPLCEYTEEELALADALNRSQPHFREGTPPLMDEVRPMSHADGVVSSDYGDVQHIVPAVQNSNSTNCSLAGGHNWRVTACAGSSFGMKGMLRAGKVMALGALKVFEQPELLARAKAAFQQQTQGKPYVCPVPDDAPWPYQH